MFIGAQYYRPPFPDRRYWADDMARMRDVGLTGLQLWMFWSWVEHEPGTYDFGDYDELVALADRNGLKVVLSVQCELQPPWIHRLVHGSEMIDHTGRVVISSNRAECNFGITPGGCFDHPGVREKMQAYFRAAGEHYRDATNLHGWDCWNELRWNVHSDGYVCYCAHTVEAFRKWLDERHGGLEGLNRAWKRRYASWDDVQPGKLPGRPWTELVEFSRFISARSDGHAADLHKWLREGDPNHVIVAHGGCPSWEEGGGGTDQAQCRGNNWNVADAVDGFGVSAFPYWGEGWSDAEHVLRIESMRSAAGGKPFWASELQGGASASGFTAFRSVDGPTQARWVWHGMGRGAKATIFWCWRDEVFGYESGGFGIVGNDGRREERLESLGELCASLKEHEGLLDSYRPDPPQAGVLLEPTVNLLQFAQEGESPDVVQGARGYLLALVRAHAPVEMLDAGHLDTAHADDIFRGLKLVVAPMPLAVRPAAAERLARFVEAGGTLLVEGELDAFDDLGFYRYPGTDDRAFAARLGLAEIGRRPLPGGPVKVKLGKRSFKLTPSSWTTPYLVQGKGGGKGDTKVIAKNASKQPLALVKALGKGRVIALGGFFGRAYAEGRSPDFAAFVEALAKEAGVEPAFRVKGKGEVTWQSGVSGDTRLVFIMNNGPKQTVQLSGAGESLAGFKTATELATGGKLKMAGSSKKGSAAGFAVPLPANAAGVVKLEG
jgi:beta-galactosidase